MSEPVVQEEKPFDVKSFMAQRNATEDALKNGKPMPAQPEPKPEVKEPKVEAKQPEPEAHISRSARREMNRLREEAAELRGRLKAFDDMRAASTAPAKNPDFDAEPQRANYATDAQFIAATARWAARDENRRSSAEASQAEMLNSMFQEAAEARAVQVKLVPNWDEIVEDAKELAIDRDNPDLELMMVTSPVGVLLTEYFVNNPNEWEKIRALKGNHSSEEGKAMMIRQRAAFHRLEGRMELVYNERTKAAQAAEEAKPPKKDRKDSADGDEPGRTASSTGKDTRLPRPTSEVAARGGSAAPSDPPIGSPAWMEARNQKQYTTRY